MENSLHTDSDDNVLLFWSGHGERGNWVWREEGNFSDELLRETLDRMAQEQKYRKLLGLIETCYSGSMGMMTEGIPGVLFVTAANEQETSKAECYSTDLGVWMTNRFTTTLLDCIEKNPDVAFRELYYHLFSSTLGSHVTVYNAEKFGNMYNNTMREFLE
jgi:glycosylphosphatidylinositol transamidase (GPIT) subunit GPI8